MATNWFRRAALFGLGTGCAGLVFACLGDEPLIVDDQDRDAASNADGGGPIGAVDGSLVDGAFLPDASSAPRCLGPDASSFFDDFEGRPASDVLGCWSSIPSASASRFPSTLAIRSGAGSLDGGQYLHMQIVGDASAGSEIGFLLSRELFVKTPAILRWSFNIEQIYNWNNVTFGFLPVRVHYGFRDNGGLPKTTYFDITAGIPDTKHVALYPAGGSVPQDNSERPERPGWHRAELVIDAMIRLNVDGALVSTLDRSQGVAPLEITRIELGIRAGTVPETLEVLYDDVSIESLPP